MRVARFEIFESTKVPAAGKMTWFPLTAEYDQDASAGETPHRVTRFRVIPESIILNQAMYKEIFDLTKLPAKTIFDSDKSEVTLVGTGEKMNLSEVKTAALPELPVKRAKYSPMLLCILGFHILIVAGLIAWGSRRWLRFR